MTPLFQTGLGSERDMPSVPLSAFEWQWAPHVHELTAEQRALAYQRKYFKLRYVPATARRLRRQGVAIKLPGSSVKRGLDSSLTYARA